MVYLRSIKRYRPFLTVAIVVLAGLLIFQLFHLTRRSVGVAPSAATINLALRSVSDKLLTSEGRPTQRIRPVKQLSLSTYRVQLDAPISYNVLDSLVKTEFRSHAILAPFELAVYDHRFDSLLFGNLYANGIRSEGTPVCLGREQISVPMDFTAKFYEHTTEAATTENMWWLVLLNGLSITGVAYCLMLTNRKEEKSVVTDASQVYALGSLAYDFTNQQITSKAGVVELTYKEAKLLKLFCVNQNQVISRDAIQKAIWEDEGYFVGRSMDVFISRLRKLLKEDPAVSIVTIHGVGYKLSVNAQ
ncbi:winged helix-turn-helix domain-containing protein [Parachryseolinea silvisoli]|jgi:DNA-binding winged helix-turn-helix (wHTH) protein|uniref:winged helix-turn-helix domain-containing protein n=1 Tax=Parachryseolinea silvisoli TaxID=2873601 RepID=UPI002265EB7A|nr:winged helix-turn-helix domain-containing protein [Parachryseolinea silvisoli]MCD9016681.1 winged helix-turn-helix domain-containing protein [Parachryseolinea silvisoli]